MKGIESSYEDGSDYEESEKPPEQEEKQPFDPAQFFKEARGGPENGIIEKKDKFDFYDFLDDAVLPKLRGMKDSIKSAPSWMQKKFHELKNRKNKAIEPTRDLQPSGSENSMKNFF